MQKDTKLIFKYYGKNYKIKARKDTQNSYTCKTYKTNYLIHKTHQSHLKT